MFRNNAMFQQEVVRFAFVFHFLIANHSKSLWQNALYVYSYFEKGCRKKCTRQSRKVLWVALRALFFKEIERKVREATDICLRVLKESNKSRFDSFSRYEQCIDHIPYYLSGLSRAHFFRQPFSKQLYIPGGWYIIQTMESVTNSLKGCFRLHRLNNRKRGIDNKILAKK